MSDFEDTYPPVDSTVASTFGNAADSAGDTGPRRTLISSSSAPPSGRVSEVWAETVEAEPDEPSTAIGAPPATPTIELSSAEARVLGSLIEKMYLTPDVYPMTTNGLATACNQKTNRDPVVDYSPVQIDTTLLELRQRNLVRRVHTPGSRATKHRQTLDEALALDAQQLALVSVLLLRGPQTVGELRLRTERHEVGFDDLGAVESCLEALAERPTPLVRQLPRRPGHKESRWKHLLGDPTGAADDEPHGVDARSWQNLVASPGASVSALTADVVAQSELLERVDALTAQVEMLQRQLTTLADKLGEPLE